MSDDATPETATAKPKGKGKKMILILVILLVLGGAGAAGGLYAAGAFTHEATGPKEDPNKPVLVLKGESAEAVAVAHGAVLASEKGGEGGGHGGGETASAAPEGANAHPIPAKGIDLPTPSNPTLYQTTYFQLPTPFTSNMTDSDSFAQITVAISTYYDARVIQSLTTHEMAVRSAILLMLAQQQEMALSTPEGKEALQRKLKDVINQTLKQKTGYGGIDNVYFTNFVIQ